jgi:hypothetical protein
MGFQARQAATPERSIVRDEVINDMQRLRIELTYSRRTDLTIDDQSSRAQLAQML